MIDTLKHLAKRLRRRLLPATTRHDGSVLPAPHLRFCGPAFKDDAAFVASAEGEVARLEERCGLDRDSRLLDVGCGFGRLAIGLARRHGSLARYQGVDVDADAVDWCRRHLGDRPGFSFRHLDLANPRYNPSGRSLDDGFRLPFDEGSFDIAYLFSIFSHMVTREVEVYLEELGRLVAPGGQIFLTAFVEEGVEPEAVNPEGYQRPWSGALHCVRYETSTFVAMVERAGLVVERLDHGVEIDGQSGFYLHRPATPAAG